MAKYIDADELFKKINGHLTPLKDEYEKIAVGYNEGVTDALQEVAHSIAADVQEVRHGRWEWNNKDEYFYSCSNCGHEAYGNTAEIASGFYNYCPRCGALMVNEDDNTD